MQIEGVLELKVTVRPELAVADSVAVVPALAGLVGAVKLIVWLARAMVMVLLAVAGSQLASPA